MLSPKKSKTMKPDSAPGMLISLTMQMLPPLAGQEINEKMMKCQIGAQQAGRSPLSRSASDDPRRYSIDDSWISSDKSKSRRGRSAFCGQGSREFEDVAKARGQMCMDDSFIGAKNVRNVLQFFKRRTSEANAPAPPLDVVVSWSQNFSTLLNDKYGLMLFRSFLLSEYSEENIEFWIACEEYKKLKTRQYPQKAQAIYSDFITVHAPKEVNLDSKTRMETMKALANPTKVTFDLAQSRIQCLMEKDSYTRFLKSPAYTSVLTQARSSAATSE